MSHNGLMKSLQNAATYPDSWDVPGLLNDAADSIGALTAVLKTVEMSIGSDGCNEPVEKAEMLRLINAAISQSDAVARNVTR